MPYQSAYIGRQILTYWIICAWLLLRCHASHEKLPKNSAASTLPTNIINLFAKETPTESAKDPRRLTQYDAYPISVWPPLPTPSAKALDVPVFGPGPRAPLVVYSQPGIQQPPTGLQLRPHYPGGGSNAKNDYSQPTVVNRPIYGPAPPYQQVYPVPNYPNYQPSLTSTPTASAAASSAFPFSTATPNAPFLVFTFTSRTQSSPESSTLPELRVFTPAPSSHRPETTVKQKQIFRVLTTPFGLAWRKAGHFINQFGTTPVTASVNPATTADLPTTTSVPLDATKSNQTTLHNELSTDILYSSFSTELPTRTTLNVSNGTLPTPVHEVNSPRTFTDNTTPESSTDLDITPTPTVSNTVTAASLNPKTEHQPAPTTEITPSPSLSPSSTTIPSSLSTDSSSSPSSEFTSDYSLAPSTVSDTDFTSSKFESRLGSSPNVTIKPRVFQHIKRPESPAPNRIRGKPHILCMAFGIMFIAESFFPFDGIIFARGRENSTNCSYDSTKNHAEIRDRSINVSFPYAECGEPIIAKKGDHMFQTNVVVSFRDGRIQTFSARCVSQKLRYDVDELPRKIEEALEELNITPIKVESQAPMPMCTMRVVQEMEQQPHRYGPSNGSNINDAFIGQQLRMEFALNPPSAAFGFLIRNCTVLDSTVDARYVIIDDKGCSVDINIFAHPHYDTYHDLAIVHWHAFKVPDSAALSFRCDCVVCTEVADEETGQTSCEQIPTPPICPDVVTSSTLQNALIFDSRQNFIKKKKRREATEQNVRTGYCLTADRGPVNCSVDLGDGRKQAERGAPWRSIEALCLSRWMFATSLGFNIALLTTALSVFFIHSHRRHTEDVITRRKPPSRCITLESSASQRGDSGESTTRSTHD